MWKSLAKRHVAATECSYAAILSDGGLVTWGSSHFGGDSREIQELELEFETLLLFHCFFFPILHHRVNSFCHGEKGGSPFNKILDSRKHMLDQSLHSDPCGLHGTT